VRRVSGRTLILNDLIANLRRKDGIEGWILHAMGFGSDAPVTPTVTKLMLIKAKDELRRQLLEWAAISSASWFRMAIPSKPIRQACCGNWPGNCRRRTSPKLSINRAVRKNPVRAALFRVPRICFHARAFEPSHAWATLYFGTSRIAAS